MGVFGLCSMHLNVLAENILEGTFEKPVSYVTNTHYYSRKIMQLLKINKSQIKCYISYVYSE